jgi:glycosyltransferase involved in cell wall biosynthesis
VRPFHLAIYSDARERGGAEVTLAELLGALPAQVRVTIVGVAEEPVEYLRSQRPDAAIRVLEPIGSRSDLPRLHAHRRAFAELQPDIVQFNLSMMSSCQWALLAAASLPRLRLIAVENSSMGVWSRTSKLLKRATCTRLSAHLAVGERTSRVVEELSGLPTGSVLTLYHGVRPPATDPPRHPRTIVNVARHDPVKGIDVLLAALPLVDPAVSLHQIGSGDLLDEHRRRVAELGLDGRVEFLQPDWDTRVADLLGGYELFVLSSRTEGLPVSIMEAMLAGLAVVTSDVGSVREEITHGEHGLVVPPEDPERLAAAINELLADPERRRAMGAAGAAKATRMFTVSATVERYCAVYEAVLSHPPARPGGFHLGNVPVP